MLSLPVTVLQLSDRSTFRQLFTTPQYQNNETCMNLWTFRDCHKKFTHPYLFSPRSTQNQSEPVNHIALWLRLPTLIIPIFPISSKYDIIILINIMILKCLEMSRNAFVLQGTDLIFGAVISHLPTHHGISCRAGRCSFGACDVHHRCADLSVQSTLQHPRPSELVPLQLLKCHIWLLDISSQWNIDATEGGRVQTVWAADIQTELLQSLAQRAVIVQGGEFIQLLCCNFLSRGSPLWLRSINAGNLTANICDGSII